MNGKIGKKGFTLIELIVVMAVLAILVLLAAPKFLNYTKQAKETVIKHDIVVTEGVLAEHLVRYSKLPSQWQDVSTDTLNTFATENKLYSREGLVESVEVGNYKAVDKEFLKNSMKTSLKGSFYVNEEGTVYYRDVKADGEEVVLTEKDLNFERDAEIITVNNEAKIKVLSYEFPNGIYTSGDTVKGKIRVEGVQAGSYKVNATMIHSKAAHITVPMTTSFDLTVGEIKTIEFSTPITIANRLGFYDLNVSIDQGATVLARYNVPQTIYLGSSEWEYFYQDDFDAVNMAVIGGIGGLDPTNVTLSYVDYDPTANSDCGKATIAIPANNNKTGQIKSKLPVTYGTYEARMKVPNSDALLNGFFLYGVDPNDENVTYEIDIEVLFIEGKWQLWATVFNPSHKDYVYNGVEPGVIFQKKIDLAFDPSADYHGYRIDFYANYTSFALDGVEIGRWNNSFDYGDMYIYSGSFYTHWLSKNISTTDKQMDIQWIRRAFNGK